MQPRQSPRMNEGIHENCEPWQKGQSPFAMRGIRRFHPNGRQSPPRKLGEYADQHCQSPRENTGEYAEHQGSRYDRRVEHVTNGNGGCVRRPEPAPLWEWSPTMEGNQPLIRRTVLKFLNAKPNEQMQRRNQNAKHEVEGHDEGRDLRPEAATAGTRC